MSVEEQILNMSMSTSISSHRRCTHPCIIETSENVRQCSCGVLVQRCIGPCHKWYTIKTLMKNDGRRCTRCFDRDQRLNRTGIWSDSPNKEIPKSYGFYNLARTPKAEVVESDSENEYEYGDFVVNDVTSDSE